MARCTAKVVLGLLRLRPMSLYDLVQAFGAGVSLFYSASAGPIKRALDDLVARARSRSTRSAQAPAAARPTASRPRAVGPSRSGCTRCPPSPTPNGRPYQIGRAHV